MNQQTWKLQKLSTHKKILNIKIFLTFCPFLFLSWQHEILFFCFFKVNNEETSALIRESFTMLMSESVGIE